MVASRQQILDNVLRRMIKEVINSSVNTLVSQYMRTRSTRAITNGIEPNYIAQSDESSILNKYDPLEHPYDPIARLAKEMMMEVMRKELMKMLK